MERKEKTSDKLQEIRMINKYLEPRKILDEFKIVTSRRLLEIQIPKEAILQFFRKRFMKSREKWYELNIYNFNYSEIFKIPKDAIILDYIASEKDSNIYLILEHDSFSEALNGELIERKNLQISYKK